MRLKEAIQQYQPLNHIVGCMEFCTPMGRRELLKRQMATTGNLIETMRLPLDRFAAMPATMAQVKSEELCSHLNMVRDINSTIEKLKSGVMLDQIELFEIKSFAIEAENIREMSNHWEYLDRQPESLQPIIEILDPDNQKINSFYIYDSYSRELSDIRKEIRQLQDDTTPENGIEAKEKASSLRIKALDIENRIMMELSKKLHFHALLIDSAFEAVTSLDIIIAQYRLGKNLGLTCPASSPDDIVLKGLVHPQIKAGLESQNKQYQAVDITLKNGVTLLTGANMSGKSILLQAVALSQLMYQFGFWIPVQKGIQKIFDKIFLIQGDLHNQQQGLSSFGAEVMKISEAIESASQERDILVIIDEPARTTNPQEGEALVEALVDMLSKKNVTSLIATHYDIKNPLCRRLRTLGVKEADYKHINPSNINQYIDFSLIETDTADAPREAINIASLLGADQRWIERATHKLKIRKRE
jgi:dsDNA-specific endonuclease/ATPase MutS2